MAGKIRTRQVRCKECQARGRGWYHPESFTCLSCGWPVVLFEIVVHWRGKKLIIAHNDRGERLNSLKMTNQVNTIMEAQISKGAFYPEDWVSKRSARFLWDNYAQEYLKREALRVAPATLHSKIFAVRKMAMFNGLNIKDIRLGHIEDYTLWLRHRSGLAWHTQNSILIILRHILNSAYRRGEINRQVHVTIQQAPREEIPHMSPREQVLVLEHIPEEHRPIFQLMMQYGPRVGEACGLCWDCVNQAEGVFWLKRTFSQSRWSETTKTKRDRAIPIMDWFEEWLSRVPRGFGLNPVFANPTARSQRKNYTGVALYRIWREAIDKAGLPYIQLKNATRHSLGFQLAARGRDMEQISRVLGHTNTVTTRSYVEMGTDELRRTLEE